MKKEMETTINGGRKKQAEASRGKPRPEGSKLKYENLGSNQNLKGGNHAEKCWKVKGGMNEWMNEWSGF